jgi:hypothetical protein
VENINLNQGIQEETVRVRRSYQTPQLISLGEIQSLIQGGNGMGPDGNLSLTCAPS